MDDNDNDEDYRPQPLWPLRPGSTCPAFSLLALLEDGQTVKVISRENLSADNVPLQPGSTCPIFSLNAHLEEGEASKVISRENLPADNVPLQEGEASKVVSGEGLPADYVVLLFLPSDGNYSEEVNYRFLITQELSSFRDQVKVRWNSRGISCSCRRSSWSDSSASWLESPQTT